MAAMVLTSARYFDFLFAFFSSLEHSKEKHIKSVLIYFTSVTTGNRTWFLETGVRHPTTSLLELISAKLDI